MYHSKVRADAKFFVVQLISTVKQAVECKVNLSGVFCWSGSKVALCGLDGEVKNGMFGYKIELKSSENINLHFIGHIFIKFKFIKWSWYAGPLFLPHSVKWKHLLISFIWRGISSISIISTQHSLVQKGFGVVVDC